MSKAQELIKAALARAERRKLHPQRAAQSNELGWVRDRGDIQTIYLERVPLDRQGYTRSGQYFGTGDPLYEIQDESGRLSRYIRASDRREAREIVLEHFPNAKVK